MNEPILHLSLVSLLLRKIHRKADAMQTDLNLDIDCQATAHKVTQFLDKKLDRYLALSGKRWYLALTTAYTLVEFAVVIWIFIYRLGEML